LARGDPQSGEVEGIDFFERQNDRRVSRSRGAVAEDDGDEEANDGGGMDHCYRAEDETAEGVRKGEESGRHGKEIVSKREDEEERDVFFGNQWSAVRSDRAGGRTKLLDKPFVFH
jgi:hypothetical protein